MIRNEDENVLINVIKLVFFVIHYHVCNLD